jgi:predicted phage terminase large subunit-like protein
VAARIAELPEADQELLYSLALQHDAKRLEGSLVDYIRDAWPIVEPLTPFVSGWHIDAVADHLMAVSRGEIRKLVINEPPGHMKSLTACVFWPTWEWTFSPWTRWLTGSYKGELATRDSLRSRRIVESPWYRRRWGSRFTLSTDQNIKTRYENTSTGYRIAFGVGGATGERGHRVVVDDPHNIDEAYSDVARMGVLDWWDQVMSQRGIDPRTDAKVIVMQRLHERDLSGHVLEQGGWVHLRLPAEYEKTPFVALHAAPDPTGFEDPRTEEGELLWPARFGPLEIADAKKPLGSYGAAAQLQQRPTPIGGGLFKREWWRFYDASPAVIAQGFETVVQSWDCAFKETTTSDYVVGLVGGKKGADIYLFDLVRDRMNFPTTCRALEAAAAKWPTAVTKLVEDKANGPAVIDQLRHRVPGLIPVEPRGSKEARAAAASPYVEGGNVYLPASAAWVQDFIAELASFPRGAHDDQVDAFSQLVDRLVNRPAFDLAGYVDMEIAAADEALGIKPDKGRPS